MALIIDSEGNLVGEIENYESFAYSRQFYTHGAFELQINQNQYISDFLEIGLFILPTELGFNNLLYQIEQKQLEVDDTGREGEILSISGRQFGGIFEDRIILPPINNDDLILPPKPPQEENENQIIDAWAFDNQEGSAEQVMKHYLDYNGGENTSEPRRIPRLTTAPNLGRGDFVTYKGRFQKLEDTLQEISRAGAIGWETFYDIDFNIFIFDIIETIDVSDNIIFDVEIETATAQSFLQKELGAKSLVYAGGEGEGNLRIIEKAFLEEEEPAGFERKEDFLDAGNLEEEGALLSRGRSYLRRRQRENIIEIDYNEAVNLEYRRNWDIGNIVKVRNTKWNLDLNVQIVGVTVELNTGVGEPIIKIQLGEIYPTIKSRSDLEYGDDDRERI